MKEQVLSEGDINCNRQVNLTYLLAGVLGESAQVMKECLANTHTDLRFENKQLMNDLLKTTERLRYLVNRLQKVSILACDDESILQHDDAIAYYYAIFMKFVSVIGVDHLYGLRAYTLSLVLDKFQPLTHFPNAEARYQYAFGHIKDKISNGEYTAEEVKNCIRVSNNESTDKTNNSKISGQEDNH